LGVKVTASAVSYDELINDHLSTHAYQAALVDLNLTRSPDPDPYPFWDQAQINDGENYSQWDNRAASEYLEQARITVDQAEREKLYKNFQVLFAKEMPALPLYYPVYTYAVDRQVQGVQMGPLIDTSDRFSTVTSWFMVAKKSGQTTPSIAPTK
jgi:peptide/nickel transport system substrate-binding protein